MKTASGSSIGDGFRSIGKVSHPTEDLALKELPPDEQREHDAVERALRIAKGWKNGEAQIKLIELIYFKQTHNLLGASQVVGYSYDRSKQLVRQFQRLVARELGIFSGQV